MSKIKELFKNKTMVYSVITLVAVMIVTIATSIAYFRTSITGTDGSLSVKSATINGVTFSAESITPSSDILPGWTSGAKTLTVSVNNTDYDIPYECTLNVSSNDITDMYLFVSGTNAYTANNGVPVVAGAMRLTSEGAKLTSSTKSTTMTYELKYKETGTDQSSQEGKTLSATVTCSLDGVNKLYYSNGSTGVRAIAYDSDGNPVTVSVSVPDSSLLASITTSPTTYGLTAEQVSSSKLIGLEVGGTGSRTVKVAVSDVASTGESIKVLHYVNNAWTAFPGTYLVDSNGEITITSDSFSPFLLANVGEVSQVTNLASLIISKSSTNADGVYNENGYRYEGTNPNNYITLHNSNTNTDETWRIIGVFPDGTDGSNVIRVRKYYAQGNYPTAAYDSGSTAYNYNGNIKISENALAYNDNYAENKYIAAGSPGACVNCINYWPNSTLYSTLLITYNTSNYIHTVNYKMYLGTSSSYTSYTSASLYDMERNGSIGPSSGATLTYNGAVGLMYPSDYGYAVLSSDCARTINPYNYNNTSTCYTNNWLYQGSSQQWLISPYASDSEYSFYVNGYGSVYSLIYSVSDFNAYSPVMALESTVTVSGTGTYDDPYVITN